MKAPGGDWAALIVLAAVGGVALTGLGFLGGYAVGYAQPRPSAVTSTTPDTARSTPPIASPPTPTAIPSPTPLATAVATPTPDLSATAGSPPQCDYADFPVYPGSVKGQPESSKDLAWVADQGGDQVASYFAKGAYQVAWKFLRRDPGVNPWFFRYTRAPACRGTLEILDSGGRSFYEVRTDAP